MTLLVSYSPTDLSKSYLRKQILKPAPLRGFSIQKVIHKITDFGKLSTKKDGDP